MAATGIDSLPPSPAPDSNFGPSFQTLNSRHLTANPLHRWVTLALILPMVTPHFLVFYIFCLIDSASLSDALRGGERGRSKVCLCVERE